MITAASVKARLKNIAIKEGKQLDYLLTLYVVERLLYRLSVSVYADNFILKGGLLLYTIPDEKARATKDIDMLAKQVNNRLENIEKIFTEVCHLQADDAIQFDLSTLTVERIKEDADYEGVRVKVTAFLDRTKKVMQLDIGFGDVIVPEDIPLAYPSLLDMDNPVIRAYSMESVIAEKFEAMIYLAEANSRMKDFYDIYSLSEVHDFDGELLKEAIKSTFIRRETTLPEQPTVFTKEFKESLEKQQQWRAFKRRIGSKSKLEFLDVINVITIFLEPIYYSIAVKEDFGKRWDVKNKTWG